jgi:signal transduction histidine kinase
MWTRSRTLARQLLVTYLLLTLVVGALLSAASLWGIRTLEAHLQKIDMGMAVTRVRDDYLDGRNVQRLHRFFHGPPGSDAFPPWLRHLPPGFSKVQHEGREWHVMVDDHDGVRYLLARDYTSFERGQQRVHWLAVGGGAAGLLVAFLLGGMTARRVVDPLLRLATQVGERPAMPSQTRFAHEYPDNEIGRLATAFDETYNELEAALQRERLFTADVGHELRTPLMVISSSSELLLDDPALADVYRTRLLRIHSASKEIDQQLAAYLMLSRSAGAAHGFALAEVLGVAQEEAARWRARAAQLGLEIELEANACTQPAPPAQAAGGRLPVYPAPLLRIVLSNLIRNALQHASSGTRIVIRTTPALIEVADDGPGIALDVQPTVFAPFVHGGSASPENLGLGLSLVQRICQHQGWQVSLDSSPGRGTRFCIDLNPADRQARA